MWKKISKQEISLHNDKTCDVGKPGLLWIWFKNRHEAWESGRVQHRRISGAGYT